MNSDGRGALKSQKALFRQSLQKIGKLTGMKLMQIDTQMNRLNRRLNFMPNHPNWINGGKAGFETDANDI